MAERTTVTYAKNSVKELALGGAHAYCQLNVSDVILAVLGIDILRFLTDASQERRYIARAEKKDQRKFSYDQKRFFIRISPVISFYYSTVC